jgi:mono/diheme cytochrome c family protein
MIAALVFVLAFLLIGLSVLFLAFSGGPRAQRRSRGALSRGSRRSVLAGVVVLVLGLGVAVPLAVAVVNGKDHAKRAPGVSNLSAAEVRGRAIFARNCATCHTLKASNAVGKVGPNLDVLHPPQGLVLDAIAKGRARGQGQMPAGLIQGQDARDVAAYIATVAGRSQ